MLTKLAHLLFGVLWIGAGYVFYEEGYDFKYGHPVPNETGFLLIAFGFVWIIFMVFLKKNKIGIDEQKILMCSHCVKPVAEYIAPGLHCPICHQELEELEGFYDRHPELK